MRTAFNPKFFLPIIRTVSPISKLSLLIVASINLELTSAELQAPFV